MGLYIGMTAARVFYIGMERDICVDWPIGMDRGNVTMALYNIVMLRAIGMCFDVSVLAFNVSMGSYGINMNRRRHTLKVLSL